MSEVSELADCGILLDVNNIYVSSQNHGFDPMEYLREHPAPPGGPDSHIAGHSQVRDGSRSILTITRCLIRCGKFTPKPPGFPVNFRDVAGVGRSYSFSFDEVHR